MIQEFWKIIFLVIVIVIFGIGRPYTLLRTRN